MLPGFTRTAAQPAPIAAKTYLGWKWMSAITDRLRRSPGRAAAVRLAGDRDDVAPPR
jgi:hypothetical protein